MSAAFVPGAVPLGDGRCRFTVWAPAFDTAAVRVGGRLAPLARDARGVFTAEVDGVRAGALYKIRLGDTDDRPDPASRHQPEGPHGPSKVVDPAHPWTDAAWTGVPLERLVFYEIHVGTFTPEGTFDAAIGRLDALAELGVTAVEVMPVSQFPGARGWGYDGTFPFAVQDSYGGPAAMKRFVDACHARGLAVALDVVYNHFGPDGNYLWGTGPAFTDRYHTPWGAAINVDGPGSDETREFLIQSALMWAREFHVDALRLDAVDTIIDVSARPFLAELAERVKGAGRRVHVIAESDRNDPKLVRDYGLDAIWNDDFHHALRTLLTDERDGYYADFGAPEQLARAFAEGFVYQGERSTFRERRQGVSSKDLEPSRFVVFAQNHDQVGNRMSGDRLGAKISVDRLKLAAAAVILSPNLPLLFMGEEYGETAPFPYFVSHTDPGLIEAVRQGRRADHVRFHWPGEPPDPQAEATFRSAVLHPERGNPELRAWYKALLALRREPPFSTLRRESVSAAARGRTVVVERTTPEARAVLHLHFGDPVEVPLPPGRWTLALDSPLAKIYRA
ncbi:MAG TPA: malto-oligosyltrehalose trehalohydrolase [Planctomycetota bacterium]